MYSYIRFITVVLVVLLMHSSAFRNTLWPHLPACSYSLSEEIRILTNCVRISKNFLPRTSCIRVLVFFFKLRWSLIRGPGDHGNLVEHMFLVSLGLRDLKIDAVVRLTGPSICSSMMTQIVLMAQHDALWVISAELSLSNGWEENAFALEENFERGNFERT